MSNDNIPTVKVVFCDEEGKQLSVRRYNEAELKALFKVATVMMGDKQYQILYMVYDLQGNSLLVTTGLIMQN